MFGNGTVKKVVKSTLAADVATGLQTDQLTRATLTFLHLFISFDILDIPSLEEPILLELITSTKAKLCSTCSYETQQKLLLFLVTSTKKMILKQKVKNKPKNKKETNKNKRKHPTKAI